MFNRRLPRAVVEAIFACKPKEARLSNLEPIYFVERAARSSLQQPAAAAQFETQATTFDRSELNAILALYGRKVAAGDWRDYAIDQLRDKAVFSVYRKASEYPLYRIEKNSQSARRQGAYSVVAAGGLIMKRGHDLRRVLGVLEGRLAVVTP